jgi:diguanylate cyclase (GGDEF)-like protein
MKNSILLVDDDAANLIVLSGILRAEYKIYTAKDGKTAIQIAEEYRPDLILLDIIMPGMDGYETLAALQEIGPASGENLGDEDIPVIFITGLDKKHDEEKGLRLGAADYIHKPFGEAIVKLRVQHQIRLVNQMRTIERLSMQDQLTEIPNRRSFDSRLLIEWNMAVREHRLLSMLMCDIDKFKTFNDTHGHQEGDMALKTVARAFGRTLRRATDFYARWGGEEFIALLPNTDANDGLHVGEMIRADVENTVVPLADGSSARVTVSVGVNTMAPTHSESVRQLILGADNALYAAKEAGRNRVCLADAACVELRQTAREK